MGMIDRHSSSGKIVLRLVVRSKTCAGIIIVSYRSLLVAQDDQLVIYLPASQVKERIGGAQRDPRSSIHTGQFREKGNQKEFTDDHPFPRFHVFR
jgi:hypothetical protein